MTEASLAQILLVEDSPTMAQVYEGYLRSQPFAVTHKGTAGDAIKEIDATPPHVLVLDLMLPDGNGLTVLRHLRAKRIDCPVVVITANGSVNVAVEAMQAGAYDFIVKPFSKDRLVVTVNNALQHSKLTRMVKAGISSTGRGAAYGFVGDSPAMQRVYDTIENAAPSKAAVFITGESGTGKEVCARAIHQLSERKDYPFIALNCAAIPRELMESEVFGHVKGAFTGAHTDREGAAEAANGGTLFLDEICEMDADLQSKLLRFIQSGTVQRVGDPTARPVDVRFICATNRDPLQEIKQGNFREDLYYRLHVIGVNMPPLRGRGGDVILIARHALQRYAAEEGKEFEGYDPLAERMLGLYHWPGNIRQLQNIIHSMVVLNPSGGLIDPTMLPPEVTSNLEEGPSLLRKDEAGLKDSLPIGLVSEIRPETGEEVMPLWKIEKRVIEHVIKLYDDNIPRAAKALDVAPSTIYRKRESWKKKGQA